MLVHRFADFGQGKVFQVVGNEPGAIERIQGRDGLLESRSQSMKITGPVGILWFPIGFLLGGKNPLDAFVVRQTFEPFFLSQNINVALGENGAKPGGKRAAAMEMIEERDAADSRLAAVKRGVQGAGKFARVRIARAALGNRGSGRIKAMAIGGEKMVPGRIATGRASGGQSEIFEVQGIQVILELLRRSGFAGEALGGAAFESKRKPFQGEAPAGGLGLGVKSFKQCGAAI